MAVDPKGNTVKTTSLYTDVLKATWTTLTPFAEVDHTGIRGNLLTTYDNIGRPLSQTVDGYATTSWQYDFMGRMTGQTTNALGGTTFGSLYEYGVSGMSGDASNAPAYLRRVTNRVGGSVVSSSVLTHDYLGRLIGVTGSAGQIAYGYDGRGRLTSETRTRAGYSGQSSYSYDASDNLNGGVNGWQYNSLNQVTSAPPAGGMPGATGITYGAGGALSGMNGRTFQYNGWGQLTGIGLPGTGGTGGGGGMMAARVQAAGGGTTPPGGGGPTSGGPITIVYDPLDRVWSVTDKDGVTRNYDYDGATLVGEQSSTGGNYRSYASGADGCIGDYQVGTSGAVSGQQFYNHDVSGNLRGVYAHPGTALWDIQHGIDTRGNPQEGPGGPSGYFANAPPTPMWGNGRYHDPASGYDRPAFGGMAQSYDSASGDDIDLDALLDSGG